MDNLGKNEYAVIDTISTDLATLLIGDDEKERIVEVRLLPEGSREGDWLKFDDEGNLISAPDKTEERKKDIRRKLDWLRENKTSK
jgi:hypothetical protein